MATTLPCKEDAYGGVIISWNELPVSPDVFDVMLSSSLDTWRASAKRGIWLKIPVPSRSNLFPAAIKHGFTPHHASSEHVTLTSWLAPGENTLPNPACHYVGVGVAVVDADGRLLVVQEKNGPLRGLNFWKVPTGMVNPNEDITSAAVREVKEETGVDVVVDGIICLRETHGLHVQALTDLFFLCKARPLSFDIRPQESEILKAEWMPVGEYLSLPHWKQGTAMAHMNKVMALELEQGGKEGNKGAFEAVTMPRGANRTPKHAIVHAVKRPQLTSKL